MSVARTHRPLEGAWVGLVVCVHHELEEPRGGVGVLPRLTNHLVGQQNDGLLLNRTHPDCRQLLPRPRPLSPTPTPISAARQPRRSRHHHHQQHFQRRFLTLPRLTVVLEGVHSLQTDLCFPVLLLDDGESLDPAQVGPPHDVRRVGDVHRHGTVHGVVAVVDALGGVCLREHGPLEVAVGAVHRRDHRPLRRVVIATVRQSCVGLVGFPAALCLEQPPLPHALV